MGNTPSNTADGQQQPPPPVNGAPTHHRRHSHAAPPSSSSLSPANGKDGKRRKSIELPDLRDPGLTFTRARDPSGGGSGGGHSQQTSGGSGASASTQSTLRSPVKEGVKASSRIRHGSVGGKDRKAGIPNLEQSPYSSLANDQESAPFLNATPTPVSSGVGGPPPFLLASGGKAPASTSTSTSSPPIPSSLPINSGMAGLSLGSGYDTPENAAAFGIGDSDTQTSMTPSRPSTFRTIQTPMPFPIPPDHPPTDTIVAPPLPLLSAAALTTAAAESGSDADAVNTQAVLASGSKVAEAVEAAEAAQLVSGGQGMASLMGVAAANAADRARMDAGGLVGAASTSGSLVNGATGSPSDSRGSVDRTGLGLPEPVIPLPSPGHSIAAPLPSIIAAQPSAQAAAVDVGGGPDAVPTLITFKNEDVRAENVFVTGTFAKGWKTKVQLAKKDPTDFSAIVSLPPGPHTFKFIVDKQWKTSKHLPSATDADGNLINYVQVHRPGQQPRQQQPAAEEDGAWEEALSDEGWTSEIPAELITYGDRVEATRDLPETVAPPGMSYSQYMNQLAGCYQLPTFMASARPPANRRASTAGSDRSGTQTAHPTMPAPLPAHHYYAPFYGIPPPTLPAQLEKGVLNFSQTIAQGSGDDNSLLTKPDHSQLNHLAASPIRQGLLTVAVTTRYKGKYVTTVYHKPVPNVIAV